MSERIVVFEMPLVIHVVNGATSPQRVKSAPEQKFLSKIGTSRKLYREMARTYQLDDDKRSHSSEDSSSDEYELHYMGKISMEPVQV